jgi:hypothetical protein
MFNTREYRTVAFESPLDIMSIMDIERYKRLLYLNEGHNKMRTEQVMHLLNIAYSANQDNYGCFDEPTPTWKTWNIQLPRRQAFRGSSTNVDVANSVKFGVLFGRVVYTVTFYTPSTSKLQSTDSTSNPLSLDPTNQPSFP